MRSPRSWPSATATVAAHLRGLGHDARWKVPSPAPDEFLVVRRVGGGSDSGWLDQAHVDIECWSGRAGSSPAVVDALAGQVREQIAAMPGESAPVTKARVTGLASFADPATGRPRVIISATVWLKPSDPD